MLENNHDDFVKYEYFIQLSLRNAKNHVMTVVETSFFRQLWFSRDRKRHFEGSYVFI